jgi:hypothetical protein
LTTKVAKVNDSVAQQLFLFNPDRYKYNSDSEIGMVWFLALAVTAASHAGVCCDKYRKWISRPLG